MLFVGALALEGLEPALASGADLVCIDLEDPVPAGRKKEARAALVERARAIAAPAGVQLVARVNALGGADGPQDLRTLLAEAPALGALMLPMVTGAEEVRRAGDAADAAASGIDLYAIIETPDGLENCVAIARSHPRLRALFFGGFDLSAALGCAMEWEPLLYARSRVVHAAAAGRIACCDSPYPGVADMDGLRDACAKAKSLGMRGKAAKHASHVATINTAFA